ncbi:S8 family peptidase [Saccharicrinis sp. 156]|uniref:S8 family peptidase n=1 Tax=Saccharicrinis sp. 156 TaxID=3417574 RepID=UPI003D32D15B
MYWWQGFELYLSEDEKVKQQVFIQIKKKFGVRPVPVFKEGLNKKRNDYLKNIYTIRQFMSSSLVWDKAREIARIHGVLDVDPVINTKYKFELEDYDVPLSQVVNVIPENRPDPNWFHANSRFPDALKYAEEQFNLGIGKYDGGETNLILAQLDTGYSDHPELSKVKKELGYNYVNTFLDRILSIFIGRPSKRNAKDRLRNAKPFKWASHGTSTAGVVIGVNTKNAGIVGENKDNTDGIFPYLNLIPYRISETVISFNNKMAHAARQAMADGCKVITTSHAGLLRLRSWKEAVKEAYDNGVIWVSAPGSHVKGVKRIWTYPSKFPETITTTVSTKDDEAWEKTFGGAEVDIAAPGFDMYVPFARKGRKYGYRWSEGTSFSTPITAAAAIIWIAHHSDEKLNGIYREPWQRVEAFRTCLKRSARKPDGWNTEIYGAGILDVLALLKCELPKPEELKHASSPMDVDCDEIEKVDWDIYMINKEITYQTCRAKLESKGQEDDMFEKVENAVGIEAKAKLKVMTATIGENKTEELKRRVNEFAKDWGY